MSQGVSRGRQRARLLLPLGQTSQDSRQRYLFANDFWNSVVKLDKMLYSIGRTSGNRVFNRKKKDDNLGERVRVFH